VTGVLVIVMVLLLAGGLLWLGYLLAEDTLRAERARLARQRDVLDAEWQALDNTRRVRAVFLDARRKMQDEAQRHTPMRPPGT
jgi:hypothetical protein